MDKQQEAVAAAAGVASDDSISMKTEYPTHEVYVSEPPPVSRHEHDDNRRNKKKKSVNSHMRYLGSSSIAACISAAAAVIVTLHFGSRESRKT